MPHEVTDIAVDAPREALWVLAHKRLFRLDRQTSITFESNLAALTPELDDPRALRLNPHDGSLYVIGKKHVLRLDAQGRLLWQWKASIEIKDAALALDETLWVLGEKAALRLSALGVVMQAIDLKPAQMEPKQIAVDSVGGLLWVVGKHGVTRWSLKDISLPPVALALPAPASGKEIKVQAAILNSHNGHLALATREALLRFDRSGTLLSTTDLGTTGLDEIEAAVIEPVSQHLWLAGHRRLLKFSTVGELLAVIPFPDEAEALGVGAPVLLPALVLIEPADGVRIRNPLSPIRYQLSALCNGNACDPGPDYFSALTINVSLNGTAIGNAFTQAGNIITWQPRERLPEGLNTLTASVADSFGHPSNTVSSNFVIDTIPPKFVTLAPADNTSVTTQPIVITGSLDDATAVVTLDKLVELGATVLDANPAQFSFRVPLKAGANSFMLIARDPPGNESRSTLRITYAQSNAAITSIASGATVGTDRLSVSGTVDGPPNTGVTVNGVVAMVFGNRFYANHIPLKPGENSLVVVATLPDGTTSSQTITVISSQPAPFDIRVEPQAGIAPLKVVFRVESRQAQPISQIEADFDGDGVVDLATTNPAVPPEFTYPRPGVYPARLTVTNAQGAMTTVTLYVVVYDPLERDQFFGTLWNGMNAALKRGDANAALGYLNVNAKTKFQPVFELLLPQMNTIIASYSPPQRLSISESIGEYAITRPYQGRTRVYLIYYLQDADGVWRLDEM